MFGFGGPPKAPTTEEDRTTPPGSPDTMEDAQRFGDDGAGVSSSWTAGRSTDADDSHSEGEGSHLEEGSSGGSGSDDSRSRGRSDSSSRSRSSSEEGSLGSDGHDDDGADPGLESPRSSSSAPSLETSEQSQEQKSKLLAPLSGATELQGDAATALLTPSSLLKRQEEGEDRFGDDPSGDNEAEPTLVAASTETAEPRSIASKRKSTKEESQSIKVASTALASISESMVDHEVDEYDDVGEPSQVFSGEEADDEMTQLSGGDNDTPRFDAAAVASLKEKTALSIETSADDARGTGGCELSSHLGVGPNPTSSTLHSGSTQPRGMTKRNGKSKEKEVESESIAQRSRSVEDESVHEIGLAMEKARGEYEKGSESSRRSNQHTTADVSLTKEGSQPVQTPSFLNRNEIFHKTASDAVAALLTPRFANTRKATDAEKETTEPPLAGPDGDNGGEGLKISSLSAGPSSPRHGSVSAFQPPKHADARGSSRLGGPRDFHALIDSKTEKKLESMEKHMLDPTKTLTDLLTAIATPEDKSKIDLAYMVRRKNACGAIKVMTQDPKKRDQLCWTIGVLPALTSVLADSFDEDGVIAKSGDKRIQNEYEAALNRAVDALVNFSMPKENRIAVFHSPGLMQAVLHLIKETQVTAACKGCTAILAYLAKSAENRLLMVQIPGLFDALVPILHPRPPRVESSASPVAKRERPWRTAHDDEKDSHDSDSDSPSKRSEKNRSVASEDSEKTLKISASQSPIELFGYDETAGPVLRATRQHVFAFVGHLCKEKENAYLLARDPELLRMLVQIAGFQDSPTHVLAVKVLAHLSRHRHNTRLLVFQARDAVPALVRAAASEADEARLHACYALQNLAQDKSCRQELAGADGLVRALCRRARYARAAPERLAAVAAIKNLCDEPANLIPLTNTPECVATLMHLAHGREEGVTELMQYRACDALATLSHWLRKIATSGRALDTPPAAAGEAAVPPPEQELFVPTLRVVTWNQWQ